MDSEVFCGSMGDWPLLTDQQRQQGVAQLVAAGVAVIVGTGAQNTRLLLVWVDTQVVHGYISCGAEGAPGLPFPQQLSGPPVCFPPTEPASPPLVWVRPRNQRLERYQTHPA